MKNMIFTGAEIINLDLVEEIYEQDGETVVELPTIVHTFDIPIEEFYEEYIAPSNETEKELARVTRDYEELARENDRLKEMNLQLLTAHGRRVYKKMTHKINLEDIYDSESGDE